MPEIVGGNLVPTADDTAIAEFMADLDNGVNWLQGAYDSWPGLSKQLKDTWVEDNLGAVLYILLRVLKFIRWVVNRLRL